MGILEGDSPAAIFIGQFPLLTAPLTTPDNAARIVQSGMRAFRNPFRLYVLHYLSNRLAGPYTVASDRSA